MDALNAALLCNNAGTRALHASKDDRALVHLTRAMNLMRQSMILLAEQGFAPVSASNLDGASNDASLFCSRRKKMGRPTFSLRRLPAMKNYSRHFICNESIGFTDYGMWQMMNEWKDPHISSAIITFNVALLYHQQGLASNSFETTEDSKTWLRKAVKMYKMAHSLLYNSDLASVEIRRIAWRIKLAAINNLSQIHLLGGKREVSRRGFRHLERIVSGEVSRRVLGARAHGALLRNAMRQSLHIVVAAAA